MDDIISKSSLFSKSNIPSFIVDILVTGLNENECGPVAQELVLIVPPGGTVLCSVVMNEILNKYCDGGDETKSTLDK